MPADIWTELAPAAPAPPCTSPLPGSRQWASALPQPAWSKSRSDHQAVLHCLLKKKKGAQNSSPRSPISQHFPILLLLSQLHSRFPQTRSLSHMKKINPPSKVSNVGHILWSNQVTEPPRDSHLLVILLPCKVKCISLIDKESWAKLWEGGLS